MTKSIEGLDHLWVCECGKRLVARHDRKLKVYDIPRQVLRGLPRAKSHVIAYALECTSCKQLFELANEVQVRTVIPATNSYETSYDTYHYETIRRELRSD